MGVDTAHQGGEASPAQMSERAAKIAGAAWGLFFLWVGVALLAGFEAGVILLGVGIVTLAAQLVRVLVGLKVETFWVVMGLLFALGGLWQLFAIEQSLVPLVLILAGVGLVATAVLRKRRGPVCPSCCRPFDEPASGPASKG